MIRSDLLFESPHFLQWEFFDLQKADNRRVDNSGFEVYFGDFQVVVDLRRIREGFAAAILPHFRGESIPTLVIMPALTSLLNDVPVLHQFIELLCQTSPRDVWQRVQYPVDFQPDGLLVIPDNPVMDEFNDHRAQEILRGRQDLTMDGHVEKSYRFERRLGNFHGINGLYTSAVYPS